MGIKIATCDDCGKELQDHEIYMDHDQMVRCKVCDLKSDLAKEEALYKSRSVSFDAQAKIMKEIRVRIKGLRRQILEAGGNIGSAKSEGPEYFPLVWEETKWSPKNVEGHVRDQLVACSYYEEGFCWRIRKDDHGQLYLANDPELMLPFYEKIRFTDLEAAKAFCENENRASFRAETGS